MLKKEAGDEGDDDFSVLEVFVAGDTCTSIYTTLSTQQLERPMTQDLIWTVRRHAASSKIENVLIKMPAYLYLYTHTYTHVHTHAQACMVLQITGCVCISIVIIIIGV